MTRIALIAAALTATVACAPESQQGADADADAKGIGPVAAQVGPFRDGARFTAPGNLTMPGEEAPEVEPEPETGEGGSEAGAEEPKPADPAMQCAEAPEEWMECPRFDAQAIEEVPGLADVEAACIDWMMARPMDYSAVMTAAEDDGVEVYEEAAKATVCGGWVAEARDMDTGEPIAAGFPTVEMVFAEAANMLMKTKGEAVITYDARMAYPTLIEARVETDEGPIQVEMSYEIEVIEPVVQ